MLCTVSGSNFATKCFCFTRSGTSLAANTLKKESHPNKLCCCASMCCTCMPLHSQKFLQTKIISLI